jgi:hypothetical protein
VRGPPEPDQMKQKPSLTCSSAPHRQPRDRTNVQWKDNYDVKANSNPI